MSSEASPRRCNPRWGDDPRIYGWEMALLASAGYWFIHAGVDWLWQIPAVTIPVLLFVAAAVSSVDARAGVLWPRLGRWLRIGPSTPPAVTTVPATSDQVDPAAASPEALATVEDGGAGDLPATPREPGRHTARADRHLRRAERRRQAAERLQPPGALSAVFRVSLLILSLLVLVAAGLPYVSLQLQKSAKALAYSDGVRAVERAGIAHWFQPADPSPYLTQATIYENAALAAASSDSPDRAAAVLDDLALSLDRLKEAIAHEPADWSLYYRTGVTALNLLLAEDYAAGHDLELDYAALIPAITGLRDWSALLAVAGDAPAPGRAAGSLATTDETRGIAARYRGLSRAELVELALSFFNAARERNPLAGQVADATELVRRIEGGYPVIR